MLYFFLSLYLHEVLSCNGFYSGTSQTQDVEVCVVYSTSLQADNAHKKPVKADEALEIAICESANVEYTIDSDNSPYLEVRANVPNTDDPTLPVNTFRMWFLGVVFSLVGNQSILHFMIGSYRQCMGG